MKEQDSTTSSLRGLGIIFMIFAAYGIVQTIVMMVSPTSAGISSSDINTITSTLGPGIIIGFGVIALAISAVEFYFGYIAFKGHPTRFAAIVCLVIAVLGMIGIVGTLANGNIDFPSVLKDLGDTALSFLYYFYWKKLEA